MIMCSVSSMKCFNTRAKQCKHVILPEWDSNPKTTAYTGRHCVYYSRRTHKIILLKNKKVFPRHTLFT